MKILKAAALITVTVTLGACSQFFNKHQGYAYQDQSVHGLQYPQEEGGQHYANYYPVPKDNAHLNYETTRSLTPPDQQLQRDKRRARHKYDTTVSWGKAKDGEQAIIYKKAATKSWDKVGSALKRGGFEVLDKDSSMGSYYVTNGKLTKDSAIYRVQVTPDGKNTQITVEKKNNEPATPRATRRILGAVKEGL